MEKKRANRSVFRLITLVSALSLAPILPADTLADHWKNIGTSTDAKNWAVAESQLLKAISEFPDEANLHMTLGWVLRNQEKWEEAYRTAEEAARQFPSNDDAIRNRGWSAQGLVWKEFDTGHYDRALTLAQQALADLGNENDAAINTLGVAYIKVGKPREAIAVLSPAQKRFPNNPYIGGNLAYAYQLAADSAFTAQDNAEYARLTRAQLAVAPDTDWVVNSYGVMLVRTGMLQEAIDVFKNGRTRFPAYVYFSGNLAWARRELVVSLFNKADYTGTYRETASYLQEMEPDPFVVHHLATALAELNRSRPMKTELRSWAERVAGYVLPASTPEEIRSYLYSLKTLIVHCESISLFEKTADRLDRVMGTTDSVLAWKASTLNTLNNLTSISPVPDPRRAAQALAWARRSMELYEAKHPGRTGPRNLFFPLKGTIHVWSEWADTAITHNGYETYGYDLILSDERGRETRRDTPTTPEDYYVFGAPVYAATAGVVDWAEDRYPDNPLGVFLPDGNGLTIKTDDGFTLNYAHIMHKSLLVRKGDRVERGEMIGRAGNSGFSPVPHLHFSVLAEDGITVAFYFEPMQVVLPAGGAPGSPAFGGFPPPDGKAITTTEPLKKGWTVLKP